MSLENVSDKTLLVRRTNNLEKKLLNRGIRTKKQYDEFGSILICTNHKKNKRTFTIYINVIDHKALYSFNVVDYRGKPLYDKQNIIQATVEYNVDKWLLGK